MLIIGMMQALSRHDWTTPIGTIQ